MITGGFSLSKVKTYDAKNYAIIDASIPPNGVDANASADISTIFSTINEFLDGPLPIPTLDQYLVLNKLISSSAVRSRGIITSTSFGGKYANLLYEGAIHFAPSGDLVNDLIDYLNTSSILFETVTIYTHSSESEALDYILNTLDEPTLALIVVREVSNSKVNYVIRQNYTVLPNTNELVNYVAVGLDDTYQKYLLSGFLTLQRSIDNWVFQYTNSENPDYEECGGSQPTPLLIPFPTPKYEVNPFYDSVGFILGLAIGLLLFIQLLESIIYILE